MLRHNSKFPPPTLIDALNARILHSFLSGCCTLHELLIDWLPVDDTPGLDLIDAIPGGCIQSLRVMPDCIMWQNMWHGIFSGIEPLKLMPQYERLAQAILRLGKCNSGRKISAWLVVPRVPYIMCNPIMECVIAVWKEVEGVVSFRFQMTEAEDQNIDERHPITNLV